MLSVHLSPQERVYPWDVPSSGVRYVSLIDPDLTFFRKKKKFLIALLISCMAFPVLSTLSQQQGSLILQLYDFLCTIKKIHQLKSCPRVNYIGILSEEYTPSNFVFQHLTKTRVILIRAWLLFFWVNDDHKSICRLICKLVIAYDNFLEFESLRLVKNL